MRHLNLNIKKPPFSTSPFHSLDKDHNHFTQSQKKKPLIEIRAARNPEKRIKNKLGLGPSFNKQSFLMSLTGTMPRQFSETRQAGIKSHFGN